MTVDTIHDKHDPLHPQLPYRIADSVNRAMGDVQLQQFVNAATTARDRGRVETCRDAFAERYDAVRRHAGDIKQHTLDHLDIYVEQFIDSATTAGAQVHCAASAEEARHIGIEIAKANECKLCVKSKSMVTEEIDLVSALEDSGIKTLETDLGEFIIQLDNDAPSHIVMPMIHKDRRSVARAFERELKTKYTEDPQQLTQIAREYMRHKFAQADLGISGANFLIADTGDVVLCTNEGNGGLTVSTPRLHIVYVGIEKIIPRLDHLPVFLKLLARSATSQPITVYTTILTGPKRELEIDGPKHMHIILLDNGRTDILRTDAREMLRCIRCGACLNACPVYRKVGGGHAYGAVYSGPIGAVITPLMKGLHNYPDLPHVSSLCGACFEACPVHIDIPRQLINLRRDMVTNRTMPLSGRLAYKLWAIVLKRPLLYRLASRIMALILRRMAQSNDSGWINKGPGPLGAWTAERDFPAPPSNSFRDWWNRHTGGQER
ncbi:MAG: iron-sulfur cluster-binding protein [Planctomycetes bacterium]|nr:iron-sulfur cluster-binding protein [Planctomycetota bacterium]